jgi:hypothetical protein
MKDRTVSSDLCDGFEPFIPGIYIYIYIYIKLKKKIYKYIIIKYILFYIIFIITLPGMKSLSTLQISAGKKILKRYRLFRERKTENETRVNDKLKKLFQSRVKKYFLEMVDPHRPITDFVFCIPSTTVSFLDEICCFGKHFIESEPIYPNNQYHYFAGTGKQQRRKKTGIPDIIPWNDSSTWTALVYINDHNKFECDTFFCMMGIKEEQPYLWIDPWFKKVVLTICEQILRTRPHYFYFLLQPVGRGFEPVSKGLRDLIITEKWPKNQYLFAVNGDFRSHRRSQTWHTDRDFATALIHLPPFGGDEKEKYKLLPTVFHRQQKIIHDDKSNHYGNWDELWKHLQKKNQKKEDIHDFYEPPAQYCDLLFFYNLQTVHKTHNELLKNLETRNNPFLSFQFADNVPQQIPEPCRRFIDPHKLANAEFYHR